MKLKKLGKKKGNGWILSSDDSSELFLIRMYGKRIKEEKLGGIGVFKYKRNAEKVMKEVKREIEGGKEIRWG